MPYQARPAISAHAASDTLPRHLGIIPDGNRRWAAKSGLPAAAGFRAGAERIPTVLEWCVERGIGHVSLWIMSETNLRRSDAEVTAMAKLAADAVARLTRIRKWRLLPIGRLDLLPPVLLETLTEAARQTAEVRGPVVNLAVGYAGREDIVEAVRSLLMSPDEHGRAGGRIAETLTAEQIGRYLSTGGQPDLDLVVRTSGEMRLSDFMIWQIAESELYFSPKLWPEFDEADFDAALASFRARHRRFGA